MLDRRPQSSPRHRRRFGLVGLALTALVGCGQITSTAAISDARYAVERAATFDAATYAVYEFTSAEAYLDKAREEWATSDFQHALSYAQRALELAEAALARAAANPARPVPAQGGPNVGP